MSREAFAGQFQPHVDIWALGVMAGGSLSPTQLEFELSSLPLSLLTALAPAAAESAMAVSSKTP